MKAGAPQLAQPRAAASQRPLAQRLHPKNNRLLGIYATSRARFEVFERACGTGQMLPRF
jgi:hypothetical protein